MYSRHSRRKSNHCALYHIALGLTMIAVCVSADAENAATLDDTARLLAGLPVTAQLASSTQTGGWQAHAAAMDKAWKTKEYFQLGPIASWMGSHAGEYHHSSATMYYMFSGPDFLYAYAFFPNASTYILAGLEAVGQVPDLMRMNPETLNSNLAGLRNSMSTLLKTHYFVTEEMKTELGRSNLSGTVPILYVFLARLGCTVLDTTFVHSPADGVRITFSHGGHSQTLYYFRTDLAGGGSDQSCVLSHARRRFFRRSQFFTRSQQLYCSGRLRNSFEHSIRTGHLSFTDASLLTARSLENTISKRWPKFTDETRHLPSWASPSATGGKQSAAF
jgi:hypothetical protein